MSAHIHTSKVWPETDIIAFQQFIHGLFHVRHVSRFVDAEGEKKSTIRLNTLRADRRTRARCWNPGTHLCAQHITATTSGNERMSKSPAFWGPHIPCAVSGWRADGQRFDQRLHEAAAARGSVKAGETSSTSCLLQAQPAFACFEARFY